MAVAAHQRQPSRYGRPGSDVRLSIPNHGSRAIKLDLLRHLVELASVSLTDQHEVSAPRRHLTLPERREHLRSEKLDRLRYLGVGQATDVDLRQETIVPEQLLLAHD